MKIKKKDMKFLSFKKWYLLIIKKIENVIIVVMNVTTLMLIKYYLWLPLIFINGNH